MNKHILGKQKNRSKQIAQIKELLFTASSAKPNEQIDIYQGKESDKQNKY